MSGEGSLDGILPLLKDAAWPGRADNVCSPLTELPIPDQPLVVFGWDRPQTFEMLNRKTAGARTAASLTAQAVANLKARAATWEVIDTKISLFKKMRFLVCSDDFLAAERILDAGFLVGAQSRLEAKMLAVGIPRRGLLMATDGARSPELLQRFCQAVAGQFHRGESPPITPLVFGVVDGAIVAHLQDGGAAAEMKDRVRTEEGGGEPFLQAMRVKAPDDGERVVIIIGGAPPRRLDSALRQDFSRRVAEQGAGMLRVDVAVVPDITPRTPELDAWLEGLRKDLPQLAREIGRGRTTVEVSVTYGQPPVR
jgi:hypothetical protein